MKTLSHNLKMFDLVKFFTPKSREKLVAEEHEHVAFNSQHLSFLFKDPAEKEMWMKLSYKAWKTASRLAETTN